MSKTSPATATPRLPLTAPALPDQKILILDIETKPAVVYAWQAYDVNVSPNQVITPGGILCVGAKWLGEKQTYLFSEWEHGTEGMLSQIHDMMSYADSIVGYNHEKFDLRKLDGEFLLHGLPPTPPCTSVDLLKVIRKMGYFMGKLAFIGPLLGLGGKLEHEGMELWTKVLDGDKKAQERMAKYCIQDVLLTEKLYLKIRPFIRNHPHLGKVKAEECPACGSKHCQSRGSRRTRAYKIQRLQCQDCGSWFEGTRSKI